MCDIAHNFVHIYIYISHLFGVIHTHKAHTHAHARAHARTRTHTHVHTRARYGAASHNSNILTRIQETPNSFSAIMLDILKFIVIFFYLHRKKLR
jgi:hypothetical protein